MMIKDEEVLDFTDEDVIKMYKITIREMFGPDADISMLLPNHNNQTLH